MSARKRYSINLGFDEAINRLCEYHDWAGLTVPPPAFAIDLSRKPKITKQNWLDYYSALQTATLVGTRNGWVRFHQDRRGLPVFMVVDVPPQFRFKEE